MPRGPFEHSFHPRAWASSQGEWTRVARRGREARGRHALGLLGVERFAAFIRAVSKTRGILAARLMAEELTAGVDPYTIPMSGRGCGSDLSVRPIDDDRLAIAFGCVVDPLAGDGGEWEVVFAPDGTVAELTEMSRWEA